jgi:hypothetical protein
MKRLPHFTFKEMQSLAERRCILCCNTYTANIDMLIYLPTQKMYLTSPPKTNIEAFERLSLALLSGTPPYTIFKDLQFLHEWLTKSVRREDIRIFYPPV